MFLRLSLIKKNLCKLLGCCCGLDAELSDDCVESILEVEKKYCLWCVCCFSNVLVGCDGKCEKVSGFVGEAAKGVGLECMLCMSYELLSEERVDAFRHVVGHNYVSVGLSYVVWLMGFE